VTLDRMNPHKMVSVPEACEQAAGFHCPVREGAWGKAGRRVKMAFWKAETRLVGAAEGQGDSHVPRSDWTDAIAKSMSLSRCHSRQNATALRP
jgi:hypothetical protein